MSIILEQTSASSASQQGTSLRNEITALRNAGFALHLLRPKTKRPYAAEWSTAPVATLDELLATVRAGDNLGLRAGEPSRVGTGYLHLFDLDIRIADLADEAWSAFRAATGLNPDEFPCVQSGSGGESRHIFFITDRPFQSKMVAHSEGKHQRRRVDPKTGETRQTWHWDWEIELFGTGKQVVLPPSIHPDTGKPYRWVREFDFDLLDLGIEPAVPSATVESWGAIDSEKFEFEDRPPLDFKPGQLDRDLDAIDISALHYDDWVRLGQALHHQFGGADEGFDLWVKHTKRSSKFTGDAQLRDMRRNKWRSFGRYRGRPVTMATVRAWAQEARTANLVDELDDLDDLADLLPDEPGDPVVRRLNKRHAVVAVKGRTLITTEQRDGAVAFGTVRDLETFYANDRIPLPNNKVETAATRWLRSLDRRTYADGVTFAPSGTTPGMLNLWRGWAVEADPSASCDLFLAHVREVVGGGSSENADYILGWLAHLVQRPEEKPGVALVLRGEKGTGKDTFAEYVARMIGRRHAPTVAESDHIVGKFNARLQNALLLHVQEGSWAGDRKAESVLKYLVTSDQIEIEQKGIDSFSVPSVLRLFISANAAWVVPASADERRWAVFEVSSARRRDDAYFAALRREMNGNGPAALLHFLRTRDLTGFNVRHAPDTEGLRNQKIASLRGVSAWWFELLNRGELREWDCCWADDRQVIGREILREHYLTWCRGRRFEGDPVDEVRFGRTLREMLPTLEHRRPRDKRSGRVRQYALPALRECRSAFEVWIGGRVEWEGA